MDENVDNGIRDDHEGFTVTSIAPWQTDQSADHVAQSTTNAIALQEKNRWAKLAKLYNDRYLELFKEPQDEVKHRHHLQESQYGSVTWSKDDKEKFFQALTKNGRHDLQAISNMVKTKSTIEIQEYLHLLKEAEHERHMFYKSVKQASHAEIEAAVEIGPELEAKLEEASDALAAFQDNYDQAAARTRSQRFWLISSDIAAQIDKENDARSQDDNDGEMTADDGLSCLDYFKFGNMLELSKTLFMNMSVSRLHPHWKDLVEGDEQPSVTIEAANDLFKLCKSLTQRILQTAIFLAESRIRTTSSLDYTPSRTLKEADVAASLDVLRMPANAFDYWPAYLKRSGATIVVGGHKKGERSARVTMAEAQQVLAIERSEGRRMSLSRAVSISSNADTGSKNDVSPPASRHTDSSVGSAQMSSQDRAADSSYSESDDNKLVSCNSDASEAGSESDIKMQDQPNAHMSRKRRRRLLEEAEDEFMEELDQIASMKEDHELRKRLGWPVVNTDINVKLGRRPAKLRKMHEDLRDWTDIDYRQIWDSGSHNAYNGVEDPETIS